METDSKPITTLRRPQSKVTTSRKQLLSSKTKFRVKVDRKIDKTATVNCKNNQKLKLAAVINPDEKTTKIKMLEKQLEFERPLMDKGLNPGSNKILFPSRKTEQELMIFKEIFVEPKEKELQKFKQQTDMERKVIEDRIATLNNKKKVVAQPILSKNVELNHSNMINSSQHMMRKIFQENFKKANDEISSEEDSEEEKNPQPSTTK